MTMPDRVKEKLVELINKGVEIYSDGYQRKLTAADTIADYLIAHGVTVQEGKPLEAFLHPIDAYKGLKAKYLVFKADTGKVVDNCFILRPNKDAAAVEALRAYANATDNKTLAEDIYSWVGKGELVQEWISVKDRFPEENGLYITFGCTAVPVRWLHNYDKDIGKFGAWWNYEPDGKEHPRYRFIEAGNITHWMPLPQPPKGD